MIIDTRFTATPLSKAQTVSITYPFEYRAIIAQAIRSALPQLVNTIDTAAESGQSVDLTFRFARSDLHVFQWSRWSATPPEQ